MKLIWAHPEGISSREIYASPDFHQEQGTKSAILFKINEKGYVKTVQQGRHHIYYPLFSQQEYEQALLKQQLENSLGNSSFLDLVASFCGKSHLTKKQEERINQLLEDIKNDCDTE
ncbi:MAG: BlaI/MecI/CopY family transcriptional regulator [Lachnospiraceae bacterium]|nr:BlaI/MecI/CopY family transcriptional regulator [Lachnospiraceae bacterium]